jgi:hypothetical protein
MTERNYYKPVELPEPPKPKQTADKEVEAWPTLEQFGKVNDRVAKELDAIQKGSSELCNYARHFHANEPVMVRFHELTTNPNKANWVKFMILVEQDLGRKAADQFEKWYNLIFTNKVSYHEEL